MTASEAKIGVRVVRSKGDYVVGRTGEIIEVNNETQRARVKWDRDPGTWVAFTSLELESKPYHIVKEKSNASGRISWPTYRPIAPERIPPGNVKP